MDLKAYFENTKGMGVLATADEAGVVDAAIYSRPHLRDESTLALIMADKQSHANLQLNPHAAYLFAQAGAGHNGVRLYLTKVEESEDQERIASLRRRVHGVSEQKSFLVFFRIDRVRPLIGD